MPPAATMATMKKDNIMIAQRPNFEYDLEDRQEETLDPVRLEHNNSVATPHDRYHLLMAFSGDNLPIGPMVGFMPRSRARDAAVRYMEQRRRSRAGRLSACTRRKGRTLTRPRRRRTRTV